MAEPLKWLGAQHESALAGRRGGPPPAHQTEDNQPTRQSPRHSSPRLPPTPQDSCTRRCGCRASVRDGVSTRSGSYPWLPTTGGRLSLHDVIRDNASPSRTMTPQSNHLPYLPFVDGLCAISILAVVAYHVGVPGVSGGFVGVDVFFVISGILIINQIRTGLEADRFSILSFYVHWALRIFPPYLQ
jgi:Acyltransferase family